MTEAVVDDIVAVLPPLLNALEALGFFQRHLHPPAFATVMNAIGERRTRRCKQHARRSTPGRNSSPDCASGSIVPATRRSPPSPAYARSSAAMAISSRSSARYATCRARRRHFIR
ncbi:hypothetical protein ACVWWG_003879 [Bradyrhizobium sp. LB7.2]